MRRWGVGIESIPSIRRCCLLADIVGTRVRPFRYRAKSSVRSPRGTRVAGSPAAGGDQSYAVYIVTMLGLVGLEKVSSVSFRALAPPVPNLRPNTPHRWWLEAYVLPQLARNAPGQSLLAPCCCQSPSPTGAACGRPHDSSPRPGGGKRGHCCT